MVRGHVEGTEKQRQRELQSDTKSPHPLKGAGGTLRPW